MLELVKCNQKKCPSKECGHYNPHQKDALCDGECSETDTGEILATGCDKVIRTIDEVRKWKK